MKGVTRLLLIIASVVVCELLIDLDIDEKYSNLTTKGGLIADVYRINTDLQNLPPAIRVSVSFQNATVKNPFTLIIYRGNSLQNIVLPRIQPHNGRSYCYWFVSDTLCEEDRSIEQLKNPVFLSIASSTPVYFDLRVKSVKNFIVGHRTFKSTATPSEPRYHLYTFPDDIDKVAVEIKSYSEHCGRLMARHANCPVFDASGLLEYTSNYFYQSFSTFGRFYVKKSDVGPQFHLAFIVQPDDSACGTVVSDSVENPSRMKAAYITITPVPDKQFLALFPLIIYSICILSVLGFTYYHSKWLDQHENNEISDSNENYPEASINVDMSWLFDKPIMTVSHKEYEKQKIVKESKYYNFLYFQIFGSILPSLAPLFQSNKFRKTHQDTCYSNFLCSVEFLNFTSFNSMTSASSVVVIGVVNLILVFRKKMFRCGNPRLPSTHGIQQRDAPKVVCLLSLIAFGTLWTIFSNCRQKNYLHIYIYTVQWTCLSAFMWIYSKRHGVRRWQQLYPIVVSSILGLISLIENMVEMDSIAKTLLKIVFVITTFITTSFLIYKYCYEKPSGLQIHQWIIPPFRRRDNILRDENGVYQPLPSKKVFAVVLIFYTVSLSITPLILSDFPITLCILRIAESQVAIYLVYYLIQKYRFEKYSLTIWYTLRSFLLISTFFGAVVFYTYVAVKHNPIYVLSTPAKSREMNSECVWPGIDWNDIRHYNTSLICIVFIVLMDFIDSNIRHIPKKHIFVF